MKILLKNGKKIVRNNELNPINILIQDGKIISMDLKEHPADKIIDLKGNLIMPGLVDVHVHLREPGFTEKETIKTGTAAAAKGGFTTICAMPNTKPVPDTVEKFTTIKNMIKKDAKVNVFPYAPITKDLTTEKLVDMKNINAFAYTNDGVGVQNASTMYRAMTEAKKYNKSIVAHTEDNSLLFDGVMHKGNKSAELKLNGIMSAVESSQIARDVILAKETQVHYHICHVSSKESIAAIQMGKQIGANVTAEVTPHHLLLSDENIKNNDGNYKMNPPLRSKKDQNTLIQGLINGDINMIATDHAPHTSEEKENGFSSPFGIIGLETAFPLLYTEFIKEQKIFTLEQLQNWMSIKPKEIFNLPGNFMKINDPADFAVFDLEKEQMIDSKFLYSKSQNTPFLNMEVKGACILTMVNGKIVYEEEN